VATLSIKNMLEVQQIIHTDASIYNGTPRPRLLNEQGWDGRGKQEAEERLGGE